MKKALMTVGGITLLACVASAFQPKSEGGKASKPAVVPPTQPSAAPPVVLAQAQALERLGAAFVGEWTIDATWSWGEALHARETIVWGPGKKSLLADVFPISAEGKEYHRYHTVMGQHPDAKSMSAWSIAYDGTSSQGRMRWKDDKTLLLNHEPWSDGGEMPKIRTTITFPDAASFTWKVEAQDNGAWTVIMDGVWKKKS